MAVHAVLHRERGYIYILKYGDPMAGMWTSHQPTDRQTPRPTDRSDQWKTTHAARATASARGMKKYQNTVFMHILVPYAFSESEVFD